MQRLILKIVVPVVCFFVGIVAFIGWYSYVHPAQVDRNLPPSKVDSYQYGREQAEADLSKGKLKIKTDGMPIEWHSSELSERLWNGYGIELDPDSEHLWAEYQAKLQQDSGIRLREEIDKYLKGYNDRSRDEIEKRFGKGILDEVHQKFLIEMKAKYKGK